MCQYSADSNGEATFWHEQQWASYALSGAGLCIVEATAVQPEGRISHADLGLWNDQQAEQLKTILAKVKSLSDQPFAIQLAHAGRKASVQVAWQGGQQIAPTMQHGWQTRSASPLAFLPTDHPPQEMSLAEIQNLIDDFASAAKRAVYAGFELIEIHAAHGYLLHQFLSPISNQRTDQYGGCFENRIRLTLDVFRAIQAVVPKDFSIGIRISATDWMAGIDSWDIESSIALSKALEALGVAYIHVSSGGLDPQQQIDLYPCYQAPLSEAIKQQVDVPVIAVGLITEPMQAEGVLNYQQADAVAIGRGILHQPRWPWLAAAELGAQIEVSPQYLRSAPHGLNHLFKPLNIAKTA